MARPQSDGLKYFSFDTDFFDEDRRIRRLKARYGTDGLLFFIYLLTRVYRNGYYLRWDEDEKDDCIDSLGFTEGFIEQVMEYLFIRSLLTRISILDKSVTIITSPGIQKRWQAAVKDRKREISVDPEIWLLNEEETAAFIKFTHFCHFPQKNTDNPQKNTDNPQRNTLNKIKEKENKINERKGNYLEEKNRKIRFLLEKYFEKEFEGIDTTLAANSLINFDCEFIEVVFKAVARNNGKFKEAFERLFTAQKEA